MFGAACAWKSILSTEYWVHPHCQSVTLTGGEQDIFGSCYSQGQAGGKTIPLQREHLICEQRKCFSTRYFFSWPLWPPLTMFSNILTWKKCFSFVLVSKVCRQSERGFHLLVHSVDQLANNIYRVNICLWLNQRRKTGHTWTIFNSCWVNIISFIGCSEELKSLKIPVQVITRSDSVFLW